MADDEASDYDFDAFDRPDSTPHPWSRPVQPAKKRERSSSSDDDDDDAPDNKRFRPFSPTASDTDPFAVTGAHSDAEDEALRVVYGNVWRNERETPDNWAYVREKLAEYREKHGLAEEGSLTFEEYGYLLRRLRKHRARQQKQENEAAYARLLRERAKKAAAAKRRHEAAAATIVARWRARSPEEQHAMTKLREAPFESTEAIRAAILDWYLGTKALTLSQAQKLVADVKKLRSRYILADLKQRHPADRMAATLKNAAADAESRGNVAALLAAAATEAGTASGDLLLRAIDAFYAADADGRDEAADAVMAMLREDDEDEDEDEDSVSDSF